VILPGEDQAASKPPRFEPGALVRHLRYGYRGVVVALDLACTAPDSWYLSNQSQPRRDQPWYHVLVDDATHATYVAQENLERDPSGQAVRHPLVPLFFEPYDGRRYLRNDRPWGTFG